MPVVPTSPYSVMTIKHVFRHCWGTESPLVESTWSKGSAQHGNEMGSQCRWVFLPTGCPVQGSWAGGTAGGSGGVPNDFASQTVPERWFVTPPEWPLRTIRHFPHTRLHVWRTAGHCLTPVLHEQICHIALSPDLHNSKKLYVAWWVDGTKPAGRRVIIRELRGYKRSQWVQEEWQPMLKAL